MSCQLSIESLYITVTIWLNVIKLFQNVYLGLPNVLCTLLTL